MPLVHLEQPDYHVSPGEVYTSYLDLPTPGCWELILHWRSPQQTTSIDLMVSPADTR